MSGGGCIPAGDQQIREAQQYRDALRVLRPGNEDDSAWIYLSITPQGHPKV